MRRVTNTITHHPCQTVIVLWREESLLIFQCFLPIRIWASQWHTDSPFTIWLRWCLKCSAVPVFANWPFRGPPLLLLGRSLLPGVSAVLLYTINFPLWYLQKSLFLSPLEGRSFNWWLVIDVFRPLFPISPGPLKWSLPTCLSKVTIARWLISARESPYPKITEGFGTWSHSGQS